MSLKQEGTIKVVHPTYGFIRTERGTDLFFLPTSVDATVCRFKELAAGDRVAYEPFKHPRGERAQSVTRLAPRGEDGIAPHAES